MKLKTIYILFFAIQWSVFAQLKVKHLPFNDLQYLDYLQQKNNQKSARTESLVDTVRPVITIKITQGNNPRCVNTGENFVFSATGFNWGQSGTVEWFVNDVSTANGFSFSGSDYPNGTKIQAKVTSTLPCAKPKVVQSNVITIETATSLEAAVSLVVSAGNNPECAGNISDITLQAIPVNGGTNPSYSWQINNTIVSSIVGSNYTYSNTDAVRVLMVSSIGACVSSATGTIRSSQFIRNYTPSITQLTSNPVELRLISQTNDLCAKANYNFVATAYRAGQNPVYLWYKNDVLIPNASTTNLSIPIENTGDEIQVKVRSSLSCINITTSSSNVFAKVDTLVSLPFFEDFSSYKGSPDKNKWMKNGGTLVSNTYSDNPPTQGLAIFDGLKYNGSPYDSVNITNRGVADNLVSLPFDFSDYTNSDNLYLHFFWMYQGLGDAPELGQGDKLTLLFKDETGSFNPVFTALPGTQPGVFFQASVPINNLAGINYLYRGFQFKFQSTGRLSGQYDVWGVDYVVLLRNSSASNPDYIDQAFSKQPLSMLKNYQSMPYKHFIADKNNQLNPITSSINNLNSINNSNKTTVNLVDAFDGNVLGVLYDSTLLLPGNKLNQEVFVKSNASLFPTIAPRNPYELRTNFSLDGNTDNAILGLPFAINNSISGLTRFDNYYAYDDGSAEYIISNNAKNEHVVTKFTLPPTITDTLREIAFQFNKSNIQLTGQSFKIVVFKSLPEKGYVLTGPEVLYNKVVPIRYAPKVNGYTSFRLDKPLPISGDFYVGYTQITDGDIIVGFDKNTDCTANTFYTSGGRWNTLSVESPEVKGSIMIRPVFGFYNYEVTALENRNTEQKNEIVLYPNPSVDGEFAIEIDATQTGNTLQIYNYLGSLVFTQLITEQKTLINSNLAKGLYIVRLGNVTKKLVVE